MKRKHLAVVAVLVPVAAVGAGMWALHTPGSAEETARDFLAAWTRQDYPAIGAHGRAAGRLRPLVQAVPDRPEAVGGRLEVTGSTDSEVAFHATLDGPVNWAYDGSLTLVEHDRAWRVKWSPAAVHPRLKPGLRIKTTLVKAEQAPILAADGTRIDTADAPGSVSSSSRGSRRGTAPASPAPPRHGWTFSRGPSESPRSPPAARRRARSCGPPSTCGSTAPRRPWTRWTSPPPWSRSGPRPARTWPWSTNPSDKCRLHGQQFLSDLAAAGAAKYALAKIMENVFDPRVSHAFGSGSRPATHVDRADSRLDRERYG